MLPSFECRDVLSQLLSRHAYDQGGGVLQGTLLMAMSYGLPIVSTPYRFAMEVLQQQRGLLVPFSDDEPLLQEAICRFLDDEDLRSAMVRPGPWPCLASPGVV